MNKLPFNIGDFIYIPLSKPKVLYLCLTKPYLTRSKTRYHTDVLECFSGKRYPLSISWDEESVKYYEVIS